MRLQVTCDRLNRFLPINARFEDMMLVVSDDGVSVMMSLDDTEDVVVLGNYVSITGANRDELVSKFKDFIEVVFWRIDKMRNAIKEIQELMEGGEDE